LLACLALAACNGDQKKETGGTAQGEILPGSASDAMLPLDTVKSQAPLAPRAEDKGDSKKAEATESADAEDAAPAAPAASDKSDGE
jgi:hypothetical protein